MKPTETRDRPYERIVVIDLKDKNRLEHIISDIPRTDVLKGYQSGNGKATYILKVKKIELLTIKLSINARVSRVKTSKRKKTFIFS